MTTHPSRRRFLGRLGATAGAGLLPLSRNHAEALEPAKKKWKQQKRIAFLGTEVRTHSHAQHFLDRLTLGYGWRGQWQEPRLEVASVYIDQFPEGDLAKQRIQRHGLKLYSSISEALTLGGDQLAVDGVVIIAEHGRYPSNEKGQKLYPRHAWFKECVKVFDASGRGVPVFNDKHLATTWAQCQEMVEDAKRLDFPFFAGSSLPVTRRLPAVDLPIDTPLKESVCVAYGGVDSYDIHALETAQCMSERRQGGEVGIVRVQALHGESLWERMSRDDHGDTCRLLVAALTRSHNLPVEGGYYTGRITFEWARQNFPGALAYFIDHRDGFKTTMFLVNIRDFNYAGLRGDRDEIISCQMYLPMPGHGSTTADFFHPLTRHIEDTVLTGKVPYPAERTLLTSGMVIAAVNSIHRGHVPVETPEMAVRYRVDPESTFWRD